MTDAKTAIRCQGTISGKGAVPAMRLFGRPCNNAAKPAVTPQLATGDREHIGAA